MLLTPENIQNQQFHVRFRGFDVDEVDAFLEKVAENYLVLVKENEKLKDAMAAVQSERDQIQSQERSFKNAIISAQNIADEMQAKARQEAKVLKENARLEAAGLVEAAQKQETLLKEQISALLLEKQKLKDGLHAFLMSHVERLDSQYPAPGPATKAAKKEQGRTSLIGDIGTSRPAAPQPTRPSPVVEAPEPEPEPLFREATAEEMEDDLSALYEKIDLAEIGEDGLVASSTPPPSAGPAVAKNTFATDELEDLDLAMPDLDGDMLFTLDDPLDNSHGPAMDISSPSRKK